MEPHDYEGDVRKAQVLRDMTIEFHRHGLGADHVREQCSTCPFAFSAERLSAWQHPVTLQMMEDINRADAFHACHSSKANERRACAGFVSFFQRKDIAKREGYKESIGHPEKNAVISSSSRPLSVPKLNFG